MSTTRWRKSSYSQLNGSCVELPGTLDGVRDSKDPAGRILRVDVAALVQHVKDDHFGR